MARIVLIGIGAGVAAALLFASVISGALLSVFLFYLAPLPIMIAALGWSHWAGLVGAAAASSCLAVGLGSYFGLAFLIGIGLPAWWLGYLALLARPDATGHSVEWYPVGRLVLWSSIIGTLMVIAAIPQFGLDRQSFQSGLKHAFEYFLQPQTATPEAAAPTERPEVADAAQFIDLLVLAVPPLAAFVSTFTLAFNLWCAGSIVRISGRLTRPWPDIPTMTFPRFTPALVAGAVACSFLPNLFGIASSVFAASLFMAYALLGFAVLHAITREMNSRGFLLAGAYAAVIVFGWPVLIMTVLGLIDAALNLRSRFGLRSGPPPISRS
jgi:hypothetical protein